jgi:hypothetical protein
MKKTRILADLAMGKGELSSAYKVSKTEVLRDNMLFNGETHAIEKVELSLKRKILINLLVGLPEIDKIILYTADKNISALPQLNSKRVIGYKIIFANGTAMEMILNKYAKQQN